MSVISALRDHTPINVKLYAATAAVIGVASLSAACGSGTASPISESDINATVEARVQATVAVMPPPSSAQTPIPSPSAQTPIPFPDEQARIAFRRYSDGNDEMYVMNADGSGLETLTGQPEYWHPNGKKIHFPSVSPDGKKIVFGFHYEGNQYVTLEIYVMKADGSGLERLTNNDFKDDDPIWSPDGTKIVFVSTDPKYSSGDPIQTVSVMNADGSGNITVADAKSLYFPGVIENLAWSPDGKKIAITAEEIHTINADGSGLENLTNDLNATYGNSTWFPDGEKIAFSSKGYAGSSDPRNWDIFVIKSDGSFLENLTNHPADDTNAALSPDGKKIAFVSQRDGNSEIYVMNSDGSGLERLTNHTASDFAPVWISAK